MPLYSPANFRVLWLFNCWLVHFGIVPIAQELIFLEIIQTGPLDNQALVFPLFSFLDTIPICCKTREWKEHRVLTKAILDFFYLSIDCVSGPCERNLPDKYCEQVATEIACTQPSPQEPGLSGNVTGLACLWTERKSFSVLVKQTTFNRFLSSYRVQFHSMISSG